MSGKFLFFDIDGTLVAGGYGNESVPASAREALFKLRENGHFVALATGRSYAMAYDKMKELGFENMVSDGGNGLTIGGKLIGIEPLNRADCIALVRECQEKGFIWAISPFNEKKRLAPDSRFMDYTKDIYIETEVVPGLNPENYSEIYKVYVACRAPEEQKLESLKRLPWCRFHETYLFVEPCDKSRGIRRMVEHFGGREEDVYVFGDERNDLSMFNGSWTKIAMGNAVPELKAKADYVTTDCDKDGIWNACRHFGLI